MNPSLLRPQNLAATSLTLAMALSPGIVGDLAAQGIWKVNAATTLVGVPQVAWERPIGERRTFQADLVISPWHSVDRAPMQFGILIGEWRHHYRAIGAGPYVGLHAGLTGFRFQRSDFRGTDRYQEGFGVVGGATVGYEWRVGRRTTLDIFAGGGTAQSKYKGYSYLTGDRYDGEPGWNESGEWLLYRGGVMLSWRPLPAREVSRVGARRRSVHGE